MRKSPITSEPALDTYGAALALDPAFVQARYARAYTLVATGRWAEALEDARAAVELAPEREDAANLLATVRAQLQAGR